MARLAQAAAVLALIAMAGGLWWFSTGQALDDRFAQCRQDRVSRTLSQVEPPFSLIAQDGREMASEEILAQPSLLYFGYTTCPEYCPLDATRNARAAELLAERGYRVRPLFVSIDPEDDGLDRIARFTRDAGPTMLGLTGSQEQVNAAAQAFNVFHALRRPAGDGPRMAHSGFTYLTLPDLGVVEIFPGAPRPDGAGLDAERLADRAACFLRAADLG